MWFTGGDDGVRGFLCSLPGFSTVGRSHLVVDAVQGAPRGVHWKWLDVWRLWRDHGNFLDDRRTAHLTSTARGVKIFPKS